MAVSTTSNTSNKSKHGNSILDILILGPIATNGPMHGYALMQRIRKVARGAPNLVIPSQSSIYERIYTLEEKGYVSKPHAQVVNGRVRNLRSITPKGDDYLEELVQSVKKVRGELDFIFMEQLAELLSKQNDIKKEALEEVYIHHC